MKKKKSYIASRRILFIALPLLTLASLIVWAEDYYRVYSGASLEPAAIIAGSNIDSVTAKNGNLSFYEGDNPVHTQSLTDSRIFFTKFGEEVFIPTNRFAKVDLPGDYTTPFANWESKFGLANLWDGGQYASVYDEGTYGTPFDSPIPQHFTIDLGHTIVLTRFKMYPRALEMYDGSAPRFVEIWGSENPSPDGSWDSWKKIGEWEQEKPSGYGAGSDVGPITDADRVWFCNGGNYIVDPSNYTPMRYLRFKVVDTFASYATDATTGYLVIAELEFFGGIIATVEDPEPVVSCDTLPNGKVYSVTEINASYNINRGEYAVFIPENTDVIRGVLVHQHGCLVEGIGASTAYDLHYQALAKKWGLALVGPDLYAPYGCGSWKEVEGGSGQALFNALRRVGIASGHSGLEDAPLLLWGHSGGGYWVLSMLKNYPERIMAVFAYSPAFNPVWSYPPAALKTPLFIRHAGANDLNDNGIYCWETALNTFHQMRQSGGYVSIANTPGQGHNFSYVRYMAVPFYESVLAQRLPEGNQTGYQSMRDMDESKAWLGDTTLLTVCRASDYTGNPLTQCWLPDENVAGKWQEYVTTETVSDITPPPPPYQAKQEWKNATTTVLTWKADADIESGIAYFNIYKNGQLNSRFPTSGEYQRFETQGDNPTPSGSDLPAMQVELSALAEDNFSISTVNWFELESEKTDFSH
ncbi:MAG: hypothetical protein LBP72_10155 [Dysgonamonadaceae bacterium]|jgi:pimeloyl-ACP methyl ester carboxylesterase|nr:hypothetical protein [Dysgonamonadaceae bacterium]